MTMANCLIIIFSMHTSIDECIYLLRFENIFFRLQQNIYLYVDDILHAPISIIHAQPCMLAHDNID